ncbi:MAG: heme ABC exporter ATP-binding protein CcmA [Gammaproteobacteria bacterium]
MQSAEPTLQVEQLDVWRGEQCLFEQLDFSIAAGEAALVLGPNGAGKTTLLRILAGLSLPGGGTVSWAGRSVRALPFEQRAEIAYRGHLEGIKKDLSVIENLAFYCALWDCARSPESLLVDVGLQAMPARPVRALSAGQKRRLSLAALRAQQARLWILDEPMTNLDIDGRALVAHWLREHLAAGGTAVVATHQSEALMEIAKFVIEI